MANTNIKYLKENNLFEAHQHFMQLCEGFGMYPEEMDEAGEDPNAQQDPNMMGGAPGGDPAEQEMGADPNAMGQPMPDAGQSMVGPDTGEDPFADQRSGDDEAGGDSEMDDDTIDIDLNDLINNLEAGDGLILNDAKFNILIDLHSSCLYSENNFVI